MSTIWSFIPFFYSPCVHCLSCWHPSRHGVIQPNTDVSSCPDNKGKFPTAATVSLKPLDTGAPKQLLPNCKVSARKWETDRSGHAAPIQVPQVCLPRHCSSKRAGMHAQREGARRLAFSFISVTFICVDFNLPHPMKTCIKSHSILAG